MNDLQHKYTRSDWGGRLLHIVVLFAMIFSFVTPPGALAAPSSHVASIAGIPQGVPPHPDLKDKIKSGKVKLPRFMRDRAWAASVGIEGAGKVTPLGAPAPQAAPPTGTIKMLAVAVDFSDKVHTVTASAFDSLLFALPVAGPGSMRDYYSEISYGQIDFVTVNLPSSLGWQRAPQTYAYYVNGQQGSGAYPNNAQKLAEDIFAAIDSVVDFSQYDNNHDGTAEPVVIIHSGPGAEVTGSDNDLWSFSWGTPTATKRDGVWVYKFTVQPEYMHAVSATTSDETIGVYAHEVAHGFFGVPDTYDTDYSSTGVGDFDLMAGGSWGGPNSGDVPSWPSAWIRKQMGIVTPVNITTNVAGRSIAQVYGNSVDPVLKLTSPALGSQEYFLVENRQQATGTYDQYLPAGGVLIWHIDEAMPNNTAECSLVPQSGCSDTAHYRVALQQADGLFNMEKNVNRGDTGDPFPGSTVKRNWAASTVPETSSYYAAGETCINVTNISNAAATMTADLRVTCNATNTPPAAVDDSYTTLENTVLTIAAPGVLNNDTDIDWNVLTAAKLTGPAHGAVTLNSNGSFTYTPIPNYVGTDSFTYTVNDGAANSNVATVTISVLDTAMLSLKSDTSLCMTVIGTDPTSAPYMTMAACTGTPQQLWTHDSVSGKWQTGLNPAYCLASNSVTAVTRLNLRLCTDSRALTLEPNPTKADSWRVVETTYVIDLNLNTYSWSGIFYPAVTPQAVRTSQLLTWQQPAPVDPTAPITIDNAPAGWQKAAFSVTLTCTDNLGGTGCKTTQYRLDSGAWQTGTSVSIATEGDHLLEYYSTDNANNLEAIVSTHAMLDTTAPSVSVSAAKADTTAYTAGTWTNQSVTVRFTCGDNLSQVAACPADITYTLDGTYTASGTAADNAGNSVNASFGLVKIDKTAPDTTITDQPAGLSNQASASFSFTSSEAGSTFACSLDGAAFAACDSPKTYTGLANGSHTFTVKATDTAGNVDATPASYTWSININAPVAQDQSVATNQDTPKAITLVATDADNDPLTYSIVAAPAHGTLSGSGAAQTYTPNTGYSGADSFTFKANDGAADSNIATVAITVTHVNHAPVAVNDSYSTNEDTALILTAPGVLSNDTDADSDPLMAVKVSNPSHGMLTFNADGSFTYTSEANWNGTDTFTYKANDGTADSNVATITFAVNAVNDAPVAVEDTYTTQEDTALTVPAKGVLTNDSDVENSPLSAVLAAGPVHGTLALNADGSFTYTPAVNWNGSDSFTYKANDGTADSNVATVTLTVTAVNDAPAADSQSVTTAEDTAKAITLTGSDVEGSPLTFSIVTGPAHGALSGTAPDLTYTPDANYNGPDAFTFKVNDGELDSGTAAVSITVTPVNDAPVAVNDAYGTNEDTALTVPAKGVLTNDSDVDSSTLTAVLAAGPAHGTLALNADGSFTYTPDSNWNGTDTFTYKAHDGALDSNIATVTITVTAVNDIPVAQDQSVTTDQDTAVAITLVVTDVDNDALTYSIVAGPSHGTLSGSGAAQTYTPNTGYSGADSLTFKANDGAADSNVAAVSITVNPINHTPVAANDSYSTDEDTALILAASGVLSNDTDADSDPLTAALLAGPSNGTLALNADGSFTYTPAANWNGTDTFTYKANDGTADSNVATVTITVTLVNDAPVAVDDSYGTDEDTALNIPVQGVLSNDTDIDSSTLTAVKGSGPAHGTLTLNPDGSFLYTPEANWSGTDGFTYQASDGTTSSNVASVTITVNPVNDAPVAANDSYSTDQDLPLTVAAPGVLSNDTDVDSSALTASLVTGPANGTLALNADGSFTYTPAVGYNGTDSFTYKANDGTADSNTATVTIGVNATNRPPAAVEDSYNTNEDTLLNVAKPGVLTNDTDADGNALTAVKLTDPLHGQLVFNADGSFTYAPEANWNGTDSFTYQASDGTVSSNVATVTITVHPVNDAPVAVNDSYSTNRNTILTVTPPGVLANDTDVDSSLTAALVSGPAHGTLSFNADGSFTYTPNSEYSGSDSFTYKASDETANSNLATVTLMVVAVNRAPVAVNDTYTTNQGQALVIALPGVLSNDTDADSNPLSAIRTTNPGHGTLVFNSNGSFTYTPAAGYNGTDSFTYKANDGTVDSNAATVTLTVSPVNRAPVANSQSVTTAEDTAKVITLTGSDAEGSPLTFSIVTGPAHGALSGTAPNVIYTPVLNYNGPDTFTFRVKDGVLYSNIATVSITVTPVNDAPVAVNDSASTNQEIPVVIAVLTNDRDVDGNTLSVISVSTPAYGSAVINKNSTITYTPRLGWSGTDSFTYKISDGKGGTATATVSITIAAAKNVIFKDDFGACDASAWDHIYNPSRLSFTSAAAWNAPCGMAVNVSGGSPAFVVDDSPVNETHYWMRFFFDPNSVKLGSSADLDIFAASDSSIHYDNGLYVEFQNDRGTYKIRVRTLNDRGSWISSVWIPVSDNGHFIEIDWKAASSRTSSNGSLTLAIDSKQVAALKQIDNDTRHIGPVSLGAINWMASSTTGSIYFDTFESRH
jgi:large repetitive protein